MKILSALVLFLSLVSFRHEPTLPAKTKKPKSHARIKTLDSFLRAVTYTPGLEVVKPDTVYFRTDTMLSEDSIEIYRHKSKLRLGETEVLLDYDESSFIWGGNTVIRFLVNGQDCNVRFPSMDDEIAISDTSEIDSSGSDTLLFADQHLDLEDMGLIRYRGNKFLVIITTNPQACGSGAQFLNTYIIALDGTGKVLNLSQYYTSFSLRGNIFCDADRDGTLEFLEGGFSYAEMDSKWERDAGFTAWQFSGNNWHKTGNKDSAWHIAYSMIYETDKYAVSSYYWPVPLPPGTIMMEPSQRKRKE